MTLTILVYCVVLLYSVVHHVLVICIPVVSRLYPLFLFSSLKAISQQHQALHYFEVVSYICVKAGI